MKNFKDDFLESLNSQDYKMLELLEEDLTNVSGGISKENSRRILCSILAIANGILPVAHAEKSVSGNTTSITSVSKQKTNDENFKNKFSSLFNSIKKKIDSLPPEKKNSAKIISIITGAVGISAVDIVLTTILVRYFISSYKSSSGGSSIGVKNPTKTNDEAKVFCENVINFLENFNTPVQNGQSKANLINFNVDGEFTNDVAEAVAKNDIDKKKIVYKKLLEKAKEIESNNSNLLHLTLKMKNMIFQGMEKNSIALDSEENALKNEVDILIKVLPYLSNEIISKAQQDAYDSIKAQLEGHDIKDTSGLRNFKKMYSYFQGKDDKINSYRSKAVDSNSLTDIERDLDTAINADDLPMETITLEDIENAKNSYIKNLDKTLGPKFILKEGVDALNLDRFTNGEGKTGENDINIVQLASQFNGLESMTSDFTPVRDWIRDGTQGPRGSLQSIAAAKHRESAYLNEKLPDGINPLLKGLKSKNNNNTEMTGEYKGLYDGGYLKLYKIKEIDDLKALRDRIRDNIGDMNFLCQWAKCDYTDNLQLQVFNAAPSFQPDAGFNKIDWSSESENVKIMKEICELIVPAQYKALAQIAALKAKMLPTQTVNLHLTLVGQGSFENPASVVEKALKCVSEQLEGIKNVKVYLHGHKSTDIEKWRTALKANGITCE